MKPYEYPGEEELNNSAGRIQEVGSFEAKTHLSALLERVAQGESFTITKRGLPIAELRPITREKKAVRVLGWAEGEGWMAADFDAPLDDFAAYQ